MSEKTKGGKTDFAEIIQKAKIKENWPCNVGGKLTFFGVLGECFPHISTNWCEDTQIKYVKDYSNQILPNIPLLPGNLERTIDMFDLETIEEIIAAIEKRGQIKESDKHKLYKPSTIRGFRHLIYVVIKEAVKDKLCEDFIWGSINALPPEYRAGDTEKCQITLKKSLNVAQECAVAALIFLDPEQRGQEMGLLLMFAFGLRNNEACAVNFGDIKPMLSYDGIYMLWIYKTTVLGGNELKASGKTRNADRIIPVSAKLYGFFERRRAYILNMLQQSDSTIENVDDLPIACLGNDFRTRCSSRHLTSAGRELFREIKLREEVLSYIAEEIQNEREQGLDVEKDPSAYLLRRNFGTQMKIIRLEPDEIQYVMGHDVVSGSATRNEFSNEEKLIPIKEKMDRRAIVNDIPVLGQTGKKITLVNGQAYSASNISAISREIPLVRGRLKLAMTAREPKTALNVKMRTSGKPNVKVNVQRYAIAGKYDRTVNVLNKYYAAYRRRVKEGE